MSTGAASSGAVVHPAGPLYAGGVPVPPDQIDPGLDDGALAVLLVTQAAELAAEMRVGGIATTAKTSVSDVVTAADRAAEAFVLAALRHTRPDDGVIGEEGSSVPSRSGRTWVIDPVDGTYNFVAGLPYWCSALALQQGEDVVLGAVHQPTVAETWLGGTDLPTTLNGTPVSRLTDRPLATISLATYLHPATLDDHDAREPLLAMASGSATIRMLGSGSVDLASVAGGRIGAWAQHSTPSWDWLPGRGLVEGAGGRAYVVEHRGLRWHLAGSQGGVAELAARLTSV